MKPKQQTARIQDLAGLLNTLFPNQLAEEWDNVGLQVGNPLAEVVRVLVCLDPTEAALAAAVEQQAQAVVSHHPLIFRPLKNLVPNDETGRTVWAAVTGGVAVLSAHTNLDRAHPGLNDWLAERLGVTGPQPLLQGAGQELYKLVVFVPEGHQDQVADALFAAGAGQIGNYDRCSFRGEGLGTFRGGQGSEPFIGRPGEEERTREIRLEVILPRECLSRAIARMCKAHPYEEVAYDLIPLANRRPDVGLGRIGRLEAEESLADFAARVKTVLGGHHLRWVGEPEQKVRKVALCGGSGASLLSEAIRQGADVLVTGDVKYHEAQQAASQGVGLIDAGHFATEHLAVHGLCEVLRRESSVRRLNLEFIEMIGEDDPFRAI